jgi:signal transduction histidine kinase
MKTSDQQRNSSQGRLPEFFHSLRWRLHALGTLVLVFLTGSVIAFVLLLRHTENETLSQTSSRLSAVASTLAQDYLNHSQFESSRQEPLPLENPSAASANEVLSLMTSVALQREVGTEGGFYSKSVDMPLGYAFPTHEGPGVKKDMPEKELPTILDLARKATETKQAQSLVFRGQRDDVAFEAAPIVLNGDAVGSVWLMKRLPGLHAERDFKTYAALGALGLAAALCVVLAFLIARNLQSGISEVESRLRELEADLAAPDRSNVNLAEIRRVLGGVDRLATALQAKNTKEHDLEEKLRHSERLAALGRVAAGVAHEVRNPLATIRLRTQMSIRNPREENVQRNGSVVLDEIARLDHMVERLLFFARPLKVDLQTVDICEVLRASVEGNSRAAHDRNVRVQLGECDSLMRANADPSALRQLLDNLISNAIDSVEQPGGTVITSAQRLPDGRVCLEVRDTGTGIRSDDLPHIFDPFFTTKTSGTGLGLSICYEIVKAHGGDIRIESEVGEGTTTVVLLPAAHSAPEAVQSNARNNPL